MATDRTQGVRSARLFYSYADKDERLRANLETHLAGLQRQGLIKGWHSRMIESGAPRQETIDQRLLEAELILLLVSPDYVASDHCYQAEALRALERHARGEAWVIPVLLRPLDLHGTPLARLQVLPRDARPVTRWRNRDQAWADVARGVREALEARRADPTRPPAALPQDEQGLPLYLCSELFGFALPLRLTAEVPVGVHLDRLLQQLGLPARVDHEGRIGLALEYRLVHQEQLLLRGRTLAQQGVERDAVLTLEVRVTPLRAVAPVREELGAALYRQVDGAAVASEEDVRATLRSLRRTLAQAGW